MLIINNPGAVEAAAAQFIGKLQNLAGINEATSKAYNASLVDIAEGSGINAGLDFSAQNSAEQQAINDAGTAVTRAVSETSNDFVGLDGRFASRLGPV